MLVKNDFDDDEAMRAAAMCSLLSSTLIMTLLMTFSRDSQFCDDLNLQ